MQARGILVDLVERFLTSMIEYVFILLAIIGLAAAEKRASQSLPKKGSQKLAKKTKCKLDPATHRNFISPRRRSVSKIR